VLNYRSYPKNETWYPFFGPPCRQSNIYYACIFWFLFQAVVVIGVSLLSLLGQCLQKCCSYLRRADHAAARDVESCSGVQGKHSRRAQMGRKFFEFCFLKWHILVYFIFLSDGGAREKLCPFPPSRWAWLLQCPLHTECVNILSLLALRVLYVNTPCLKKQSKLFSA